MKVAIRFGNMSLCKSHLVRQIISMTGHNHHPDCGCGWCVGGWRGSPRPSVATDMAAPARWPDSPTYETYTNPNARCPVCGASVYFYSSYSGSKVYFDELGPPWSKHPCTDKASTDSTSKPKRATFGIPWEKTGWKPISIGHVSFLNDDWASLAGRRLDNHKSFLRLVPKKRSPFMGMPAQVLPLNKSGIGKIAWPDYGIERPEGFVAVMVHRSFSNCRIIDLADALKGSAEHALKIAKSLSFDWGEYNSNTSEIIYPSWLDWAIARYWFLRAAELGSYEAIEMLKHPIWQNVKLN